MTRFMLSHCNKQEIKNTVLLGFSIAMYFNYQIFQAILRARPLVH